MKTAVAIRHIQFEDMGTLEPLLQRRGYRTEYCGAETLGGEITKVAAADILIVLGAPIGACDEDVYPFLNYELSLIRQQLDAQRPLLGICLGAQLMARVLGAPVAAMARKEIGFSPVELTASGLQSPLSGLPDDTAVLHWHGDQFAIPSGAESLARTALCPHQAFAVGKHALGLQFHLEADTE
ncbi:MAG: gamma-glutamyl-gamma-aminobutyrate hydrolase family protein, partial [Acidobacteriaceae bacterium]